MTTSRPGGEFFGHRSSGTAEPARETSHMPRFGTPASSATGSPSGGGAAASPFTVTGQAGTAPTGQTGTTSGTPTTVAPAPVPPPPEGLMSRARADDPRALEVLFGQFVPAGERIVETRYMGVMGLWGIGTHSFAAITERRVASLRVGLLGELLYNDGALEYVNSSAVHQPSRLQMYLPAVAWAVLVVGLSLTALNPFVTLLALVVALAGVPFVVKMQYRLRKSGLVFFIREGLSVYVFIDRRRIALANHMYRLCCDLRDERIRAIGQP